MSSNPGKVSFSFSKITKKPSFQVQPKETVKKVDKIEFIGSIENNSVKLINAEEPEEKKPLVIPLQHPNLLIQSIIDTVKARSTDNNVNEVEGIEKSDNVKENGNDSLEHNKKETLEEMAARELLTDAAEQFRKKPKSDLTVPLANQNYDKQESSLEDYENIPVGDFGLAMLRGMGWDPKKGIGKNGKIVKVEGPTVRPKGLGLGADKAISSQKPVGKNVSEKDVLGKGSKVRVTVGPYKNLYGTIEGFDDDAGRISVFMAIANERISMNECFVQLVTPEEFSKYSKVLNINAYNNYKEKCSEVDSKVEETRRLVKKDESPDSFKTLIKEHPSSSYSKSKKYYSTDEEMYSKKESSSSLKDKKSKKYDSDSDSDSYKHKKSSKNSSSKDKYSSKYNFNKDEKDHRLKYESKYKKYGPDSDSSEDEKYNKKNLNDSRKGRDRSRNSSGSDDNERRRKHKKKKHRSRSRSRR